MDGEPVPDRTSLEAHQTNEDYRDGVWVFVAVDISKLSSKTKRLNITLPARVVAIVDTAAVREGVSRRRSPGARWWGRRRVPSGHSGSLVRAAN